MPTRRWDPWRELAALEAQVGTMLDRSARPSQSQTQTWAPALDAFHRDGHLIVRLELPGVAPDQVDISVTEGVLVVRGTRADESQAEQGSFVRRERTFGSFERQVLLPEGTDAEGIEAGYDLGVLEIRVPHPKVKEPTKVKVQVGTGASAGAGQTAIDTSSSEQGKATSAA
ncbi:MAG TPA: Hsp20/alpha crystallin family protein [Acidimicrobiales bacterium]|nr:Hsp20/alpha crystallin family protein [Acidimicrobiales bacterium]